MPFIHVKGASESPDGTMSVHLMNMEAGGEAVLVTFARVGTSAQSFHPVVDGKVSRFTLAGNGRMTDSVTGSIWDAVTGECLSGPMKGASLSVRSTGMTRRDSRRMLNS